MNRTIVVTGSASGIGKSIATLLRNQGDCVVGVDVRDAEILADLGISRGRQAMVEEVRAKTSGVIDGLVVNAGIAKQEPVTLSVNYFGAVATLEGLHPLLVKGENPRAVVVASLALQMSPDMELVEACLVGDEAAALKLAGAEGKSPAIYSSAKRALARWTRRQAIKPAWAGAGILLNAIAPGLIQTAMTQAMIDDPKMMAYLQDLMPMPVGHYGQPEDIGHLALYLLSPENQFMVGQVIFVDGGSEATTRGEEIW
jgi:NAD(P)-dependent dehydrogenase (short-subunit alcohol dehydrogenase family)